MLCVLLLILEFIVAILVVRYFFGKKEGFDSPPPSLEIVIARYEEDLSWFKAEVPETMYKTLFIYNKGKPFNNDIPQSIVVPLPNLGRESHSYLTHVVEQYDNLADFTMFLPGSVKTHENKTYQMNKLIEHFKTNQTSAIIGDKDEEKINEANNFTIDYYEATSPENSLANPQANIDPSEERPLNKWFQKHFGEEQVNCVSYKGIILASRTDIQKRPKEFYQKMINELLTPNPEVVHYTERTWKHIFSIEDANCIS